MLPKEHRDYPGTARQGRCSERSLRRSRSVGARNDIPTAEIIDSKFSN